MYLPNFLIQARIAASEQREEPTVNLNEPLEIPTENASVYDLASVLWRMISQPGLERNEKRKATSWYNKVAQIYNERRGQKILKLA